MNAGSLYARAQLLVSQRRFEQAQEVLGQHLGNDPEDAYAHSLMAICIAQDRDKLAEANRFAERAIHLMPDDAYPHYIHSVILDARNKPEEALEAIAESLRLDPSDPDAYGLQASLYASRKKWKQAISSAEAGLQYDPEHQRCQSIRVFALERSGRVGDAVSQADQAVQDDPDSADAHASRGWALLQKGDHREAQVSFREALRLEPSNDFARQGMIQALNSGNFFFRMNYGLMIKLSRLDSRVQWALLIGLWLLVRNLDRFADKMPGLKPFVLPIGLVYLLFAMMSWILEPVFNTFLRFHPFGKHLLSNKEKWASNLIAGAVLAGALAGLVAVVTNEEKIAGVIPLLQGIYLTIPFSIAFRTSAKWATTVATIIAVIFALIFLVNCVSVAFGFILWPLITIFTFGILVYCFAGQVLLNAEEKY